MPGSMEEVAQKLADLAGAAPPGSPQHEGLTRAVVLFCPGSHPLVRTLKTNYTCKDGGKVIEQVRRWHGLWLARATCLTNQHGKFSEG